MTMTGPVESTPPDCEGQLTYTWTYEDCTGATVDYVHTVTIDIPAPTAPAPTSDLVTCYAAIVLPTPPVVNDACGTPMTMTGPVESTPPDCEGQLTYTWTYEDCTGATVDYVHTVTIDIPAPTAPAPTSDLVTCYAAIVLPTPPVVNDACGTPMTMTGPVESTPPDCEGQLTYTWTYEDCTGATVDYVHTVTIDIPAPTAPAPTSDLVTCYAAIVLPTPPVVNDACGTPMTMTGPVESTPPDCEGQLTYTWTYEDCTGATVDYVHTVTIDIPAPTAPAPTSDLVTCYAAIVLPTPPVVNDACGTPMTMTGPVESTPPDCEGQLTYTWTYEDCTGATVDYVHTVTIDIPAPTAPAPTSDLVTCYAAIVLPTPPVVNDACGTPMTMTGPVESTPPDCEGQLTYTWTYEDCTGATVDYVHTVTIDIPAPTAPAPTSDLVTCYAAIVLPTPPVVNDACGTPMTMTGPVESTPPDCEGQLTYTWTYEDCTGATVDYVHTVTIDIPAPTAPAPTSDLVTCYAAIVLPTPPVVNDACGTPMTMTGPVESTPPDCEGQLTYTWTYEDCTGATVDYVHTVTIDIPAPTAPAPTSDLVTCYAAIVLPTPPVVNDACGTPMTMTGPVESTPPDCEGQLTYTWTYEDCTGATVDYVHTVTIDIPAPTAPAPTSDLVTCYAAIVLPTPPVVNDACGTPMTMTGPVESTPPDCEGQLTYTWTYEDCTGATVDYVHTVTIDIPAPTAPAPTSDLVTCYAAIVLPTPPVVNDACGTPMTMTGPVESTPPDCEGQLTYTWTYEDCTGATVDYVHTVTIDIPAPTAPAPTSDLVTCYAAIVLPTPPVVNDACGTPMTMTGPVESTPPDCEGQLTYTWTYEDCTGATVDYVHTVTIDIPAPTAPAPTSDLVTCYAAIVLPTPPVVNHASGTPMTMTGPVESTPPD